MRETPLLNTLCADWNLEVDSLVCVHLKISLTIGKKGKAKLVSSDRALRRRRLYSNCDAASKRSQRREGASSSKVSSTPIPLLSPTLSMTNNGGVRAGSRVGYGITDRQSRGEGGQRAHPHTPKNLHSPVTESIKTRIIGCGNASPLLKQKIVIYPLVS